MTEKDWKDWHVVEEEQEEEERRLMRNPHQMEDVGMWTKFFLTIIASPFLFLYLVHRVAFTISLPILWVAIGVAFDPWKPFARPLAMLVGLISTIAVLVGFGLIARNPSILFDASEGLPF